MESKANLFPHNFVHFLETSWWLILCCGLSGVYLGTCYQAVESWLNLTAPARDWTLTIRCVAAFVGLNHLTARITFADTSQFLLSLLLFCFVFWFWFDRSAHGLLLSLLNALAVLLLARLLRHLSLLPYTDIQFTYVQMCLVCLVFSGSICLANIGRLVHHVSVPGICHLSISLLFQSICFCRRNQLRRNTTTRTSLHALHTHTHTF